MIVKENQQYVIGVDGGGTKTVAALADLSGKILAIGKSGSSSPRNVGIKKAMESVADAISQILRNKKDIKILSVFIGLPSVAEQFRTKKDEIKKELLKHKEISPIFQGKIKIESDQIVAFASGTDEKDGVLLIAGTGTVSHGWREEKEHHTSGVGWLADEGASFWVGQKVFQAIFKELDGRAKKTSLTKLVFKKIKAKTREDFLYLVYSPNFTEILTSFSIHCDTASKRGDKIAIDIMIEAGKELALSATTVIKKLNFQKKKFPLVLVGSMFKSEIILGEVKKRVKKIAPKAEIILPKQMPVKGAVKLALAEIQWKPLKRILKI